MARIMNIGFIGAGSMAESLINGICASGGAEDIEIVCSDILHKRLEYVNETYGAVIHNNNLEVVKSSDVIIIAVKPDKVEEVVKDIRDYLSKDVLVISIAAGISSEAVEKWIDKEVPVIRVMPNTPCLIGQGVSAFSLGQYAEESHAETAERILSSVGSAVKLPEKLMNSVTALSGSGPAYVYLVIEALVDAGVSLGLSRDAAQDLAVNTIIGAANMVKESGEHPAVLKSRVMSPGGTTAAGLQALEAGKIRTSFNDALNAAYKKAKEIGG